jgi:hypothetical protein
VDNFVHNLRNCCSMPRKPSFFSRMLKKERLKTSIKSTGYKTVFS